RFLSRLGGQVDERGLVAALREVPVDGVVAQVRAPAYEPARERRPRIVEHLRKRLVPVDEPRLLAPEGIAVVEAARVELAVRVHGVDVADRGRGSPLLRMRVG